MAAAHVGLLLNKWNYTQSGKFCILDVLRWLCYEACHLHESSYMHNVWGHMWMIQLIRLSATVKQRKAQIEAGWLEDDDDMMDPAEDIDLLRQAEEQLDAQMQQLGSYKGVQKGASTH